MGVAGVSTGGSYLPQTGKVPIGVVEGRIGVGVEVVCGMAVDVGEGAGGTQPESNTKTVRIATKGETLRIDMEEWLLCWAVSRSVDVDDRLPWLVNLVMAAWIIARRLPGH